MTRETILRNRLEMTNHNLYCCSENYLMTKPKKGMEQEHKKVAEEVEILTAWIKEFQNADQQEG